MTPVIDSLSDFPVTCLLMLVIAVVSLVGFSKRKFYFRFILHPYSLRRHKEYDRLLTSEFLHNSKLHLLINEALLYVFGSDLEEFLRRTSNNGSLKFLVIYAGSLMLGTIATSFRHLDDFDFASCGSSGSIMGVMFSFMMLAPQNQSLYLPVIGDIKNSYSILIYILVMIIFRKKKYHQMINLEQHFFGAVGGVMTTLLLFPNVYSKILHW